METVCNDHDEGIWQGFHPASSFESPVRMTTSGTNRSPLSDLAKHPAFRSPGDGMGEESIMTESHYHNSMIPQVLDDSQFSDAQLQDIHDQHQATGETSHLSSAEYSRRQGTPSAIGPQIQDTPGYHQTKPVGGTDPEEYHDL